MILQEIFDLIANMNKKEKSFFVRYTKMYSNNSDKRHYILLYDQIYQQVQKGKFDENKLLKRIEKKIGLKNLSNHKKYLHQQLLQSLVIYHKKANPSIVISNAIQAIQVLYNKGLTQIGNRLLRKAKTKTKKSEDFGNLIYVLNLESNITSSKNNSYDLLKTERDLAIQQFDQINELHLFNELCFDLNIKECFFAKDDPRFEELYYDPILKNEAGLLSNKAKLYCYMTKSLLLCMACDFEKSRFFQYKILEIIDDFKILESSLVPVYQNIIYHSIYLEDFETYHYYEKKMQAEMVHSVFKFKDLSYQRTSFFYYRIAKKHKEGMDLVAKLSTHYLSMTRPLNLLEAFLVAEIIPFLCTIEEYTIALDWANFWHNLPTSDLLIRYKLVIKALEIIIHLELNNLLLVSNLLIHFKREIKKQISISDFEKILLDFFNKSCTLPNDKKSNQVLIKTTALKIEALDGQIKNPFWFRFFDFASYFKNKVQ